MTLALCHFLFDDLLPLLPVNTCPLLVQTFSVFLNHSCNALQQTEDTTDGCCMNVPLNMAEQGSGMLVAMLCGNTQPFHTPVQISGNTQTETIDFAKLVFGIGIALESRQFKETNGFLDISFHINFTHAIHGIHTSADGGLMVEPFQLRCGRHGLVTQEFDGFGVYFASVIREVSRGLDRC